jgi:hypothetical protein
MNPSSDERLPGAGRRSTSPLPQLELVPQQSRVRGTWVYYRVEPSVLAAMGKLLTLPAAA